MDTSSSSGEKPSFKRFNDMKLADVNFDFHLHTTQTDGQNTVEEMIEQAKKLGLDCIAITDHVRRSTDWFYSYKERIKQIRNTQDMDVFIGIEAKALDFHGKIDAPKYAIEHSEIVIGSVHRYPNGSGGFIPISEIADMGEEKAFETEFKIALGLLSNTQLDVLGHPLGICSNIFDTFYEGYMEELMIESLNGGVAIEINTKFPLNEFFFRLLEKINPFMSIGSDAHHSSNIMNNMNIITDIINKVK